MMSSIVTFYSYKGGVGRSMALANIAVLLARRGLAIGWETGADSDRSSRRRVSAIHARDYPDRSAQVIASEVHGQGFDRNAS